MAAPLGERVAAVETRLDSGEQRFEALDHKIDQILAGQQEGRDDRAKMRTQLDALQKTVEKQGPDVQTVRDAKTVLRWSAWVASIVAAIISTAWAAWTWLAQHIHFR